jgi:hypothetical protein
MPGKGEKEEKEFGYKTNVNGEASQQAVRELNFVEINMNSWTAR